MRGLLAVFILCVATGALCIATEAAAGDWWIQPFGEASWYLDSTENNTIAISTEGIDLPNFDPPETKPTVGGGLMIGSTSEGGGRIAGFVVEYIAASATSTLTDSTSNELTPDPNDTYQDGQFEISTSAIQINAFIAGRIPFLSGDTFQGWGGGGIGAIIPTTDLKLNYQEEATRILDDGTTERYIADREEVQTISGSAVVVDAFLMETWGFSRMFGLSVTVGFRASMFNQDDVETTAMDGTYRTRYTGPYARVGLTIDI